MLHLDSVLSLYRRKSTGLMNTHTDTHTHAHRHTHTHTHAHTKISVLKSVLVAYKGTIWEHLG